MYFQSDCTFGGETHTVDGETPFLGLPVFDSADQVIVVGEGIFLRLKPKNWSSLSCSSHKNNISDTLISRLMPNSIDSKTLVNVEKGFLYLQ